MDLVDIDQVLDNLEMREAAADENKQLQLKWQKQEQQQQQQQQQEQKHRLSTATATATDDVDCGSSDGKKANKPDDDHMSSVGPTSTRTKTFVGVSQVFSSLNDYRNNVKSLEEGIRQFKSNDQCQLNSNLNAAGDDDDDDDDDDDEEDEENSDRQVHIHGHDNDNDDDDDDEEGEEIHKFYGKDNRRRRANGQQQESSSNSITTSSSSTFSSGTSPGEISADCEIGDNDTSLLPTTENVPKIDNPSGLGTSKSSDDREKQNKVEIPSAEELLNKKDFARKEIDDKEPETVTMTTATTTATEYRLPIGLSSLSIGFNSGSSGTSFGFDIGSSNVASSFQPKSSLIKTSKKLQKKNQHRRNPSSSQLSVIGVGSDNVGGAVVHGGDLASNSSSSIRLVQSKHSDEDDDDVDDDDDDDDDESYCNDLCTSSDDSSRKEDDDDDDGGYNAKGDGGAGGSSIRQKSSRNQHEKQAKKTINYRSGSGGGRGDNDIRNDGGGGGDGGAAFAATTSHVVIGKQRKQFDKIQHEHQYHQPITFGSTMDEISDTELDSMLQEMDIDEFSHFPATTSSDKMMTGTTATAATTNIENNSTSDDKDEQQLNKSSSNDDNNSESCYHQNQGDNFSQASTVEFPACGPADEPKLLAATSSSTKQSHSAKNNDIDNDNDDADNDGDFDVGAEDGDGDDEDDDDVETAAGSNCDKSFGGGGGGGVSSDHTNSSSSNSNNDGFGNLQKRKRPTTLDLPKMKINLYANAGQTPPGMRYILPESTSDELQQQQQQQEIDDGQIQNASSPEKRSDCGDDDDDDDDGAGAGAGAGADDVQKHDLPLTGHPVHSVEQQQMAEQQQQQYQRQEDEDVYFDLNLIMQQEQDLPEPQQQENLTTSTNDNNYNLIATENLGKFPPIWVPDNQAIACMQCQQKFTMIKRRHHCRCCGKVLCSICCSQKFKLEFLAQPESRVCVQCFLILTYRVQRQQQQPDENQTTNPMMQQQQQQNYDEIQQQNAIQMPNPNNPMEYCSTISPLRQISSKGAAAAAATTPTTAIGGQLNSPQTSVVVQPVHGVLKKDGDDNHSRSGGGGGAHGGGTVKRKSVMFSDGIAPGSDLASQFDRKWSSAKQVRRCQQNENKIRQKSTESSDNIAAAAAAIATTTTTGATSTATKATPTTPTAAAADSFGFVAQLFRGSIPPIAAAAVSNAIQSGSSDPPSGGGGGASTSAATATSANVSVTNDVSASTSTCLFVPSTTNDNNQQLQQHYPHDHYYQQQQQHQQQQQQQQQQQHQQEASSVCNYRSRRRIVPPSGINELTGSFIPTDDKNNNTLPPLYISKFEYKDVVNNQQLVNRLQNETLKFALHKNLFVFVRIVQLKCCVNKKVISFTTLGMHHVGNDEIVILLEFDNKEEQKDPMTSTTTTTTAAATTTTTASGTTNRSGPIPRDIFESLYNVYCEADMGRPYVEFSFSLGLRDHGGFLYIRSTFQCMQNVHLPESPFLIGLFIHRLEVPWAKVFPLRLMLRLGAEYRYYPCPHVSVRDRESVFVDIGPTIINFLADFRNYTYTLAFIKGMYIHMEDRRTSLLIPRNRYDQIIKAINNSSDHILAFGGNFSKRADGHLVCIQNTKPDAGEQYSYSTQAINIQGQPRKVTGASFFVLNEALKNSSGLSGKCNIVEDGLMVQILSSKMEEVRTALKKQEDIEIVCGPFDAPEEQTEIVAINWVDDDVEFNIGVKSPIDGKLMDGIPSIRVHSGFAYSNSFYTIRWTEVFIIQSNDQIKTPHRHHNDKENIDISKISEQIAKSTSIALLPFLDLLVASENVKIALRATLHQDNVCYEAGAQGVKLPPLYMNALDHQLIPTLHKETSDIDQTIILEIIFHILNL